MEGSSANENAFQNECCETFLNEVECEDKYWKKLKKTQVCKLMKVKFQKMTKKKLSKIWNYCIPKGKKQRPHNRNVLC